MTYKKELLLYLYENNHGSVEIYPVSEKISISNADLKRTINELMTDGLIVSDDPRRIGSGDPQRLETVKSLHIKARITPDGEIYVRDTYMKKNHNKTVNIDQLINIGGDNNAPISQTKDHSSSHTTTREITNVMIPKKAATKKGFWDNKYVVSIVSGIIVAIIGYFLIKHFN